MLRSGDIELICVVGETGCGAGAAQTSLIEFEICGAEAAHTSLVDPATLVSSSLELEKTASLAYDHVGIASDGNCTPHADSQTSFTGSCVATVFFCSNGLLSTSFAVTAGSISWWRAQSSLAC